MYDFAFLNHKFPLDYCNLLKIHCKKISFLGGKMVGWVKVLGQYFFGTTPIIFLTKKLGFVFGKIQFCDVI
jgi:hypothetical protein